MTNPETLVASLLYLMTRHRKSPQNSISKAIVEHFDLLAAHPDCQSTVIRDAARRLAKDWKQEIRIQELKRERSTTGPGERKPNQIH
jgi:hypothetical protein